MDSQRESRKRLRPWLERMIESNTCPGLVWENKEERTFRIPWRHFNNKDWDEKYSKIFMEWARHTGKYHEGDKLEYPVWKTRLRCALKKIPEILELQEQHHPEDPDPYRVYKFVDSPSIKKFGDIDSEYSASPGSSSSFLMNSPAAKDYLETSVTPPPQQYFENTFLGPKQSSNVPTVVYDEESFNYNNLSVKTEDVLYPHGFASTGRDTQYDHPKLDQGQFQGQFADFNHYNISSEPNFLDQMSSSSQNYSGLNSIVATSRPELSLLESSLLAAGMQSGNENIKASLPSDLMSVESSDLCAASISDDPSLSVLQDRHSSSNVHVMQLNVKYGFPSNTVLQNKVGVNGCRLYFGAPQLQHTSFEEELFGPKTVTQIEMPMS
uniref:IRF tryptophan pentad repeat domain-containing protein n=1 Tax=Arion vulgaris TaxID=1028688 RepID=A0A0B6YNU9_9EUPU